MANKLKNVRLSSVDLVRAGANQKADICIVKSLDGTHDSTGSPQARTIGKSDPDRYDTIVEVFP